MLVLAFLLARYLSAPIDRLAAAAERVRELSLKDVAPLSTSLFREISSAVEAEGGTIDKFIGDALNDLRTLGQQTGQPSPFSVQLG